MKPGLILFNGTIVTMDNRNSICEAVAIENGKITSTGSNEEILNFVQPGTKQINLEGKTVLPGFIDAHQHMFQFGFNLLYVDCRLHSISEIVDAIRERAKQAGPGEWIIGWGFDEANLKEGRKPNKWDFEGIDHPIYITRYCQHEAVVNQKALELAGITNETVVANGFIEKNGDGDVTGVLVEHAKDLVQDVMPGYTKQQMKEAIKFANDFYIKNGITSVHEAGLGFMIDAFKEYEVIKEMKNEGSLDVRMYLMVLGENFEAFLNEHALDDWDNQIKPGPMKLFADGTLSGKTAALRQDFNGSPGNKGMLLHTFDDLFKMVEKAHNRNMQVSIHAIGDRAITQVLDVYEKALAKNPRSDHRHRIEHASVTGFDILERMKSLGVIPVPQPGLVHFAGDVYMENLNPPARDHVFSLKNFIQYGLKPAGSSDCPIITCSPLLGIFGAMKRITINGRIISPGQRISLIEAIKMYTVYAAYASFEEDVKGTIESGKLADLTILPPGFMDFAPEEIKDTEVEMTIIGGEVVYNKNVLEVM